MQYQYQRLEQVCSIEEKVVRGNQMLFMTKDLSEEIMKRSRQRDKFLKNKCLENIMLYIQQRKNCVSLLRTAKFRHYANLNEKKILNNKQFWKVVQPLFSDKSMCGDKINLTENGKWRQKKYSRSIKQLFLKYSEDISQDSSGLKLWFYCTKYSTSNFKAIVKYKNHPSILTNQSKCKGKNKFSFIEVTTQDIEKYIFYLETKKSYQASDIPTKDY